MMSLISIVTGTYNAASTLDCNLDCLNKQSFQPEHILVDGCSTDGTLDIIKGDPNPQRRFISEPDKGIYDAMNKGIRLATGEVIGILNADDFYAGPDVLAKVAKAFKDPEVDACYGDLVYINDVQGEGANLSYLSSYHSQNFQILRYWKSGSFNPQKFYWGWMPPHPTFFVRRRVYEQYGLFNLDLGSAADYELMLRFLLRHRINVKYIPEVLVYMRVGGASNESVIARIKANRNDRKAWEVNGLKPFPWTLALKPIRKIPQWFFKPPKEL
jgi:glycosyltransferase